MFCDCAFIWAGLDIRCPVEGDRVSSFCICEFVKYRLLELGNGNLGMARYAVSNFGLGKLSYV